MPTFDLQEANNPLLQLVVFPNARATSLKREQLRWLDLVRRLERPQERPHKAACELLKLAAFGDTRTPKGCLRHDANLLDVCGLEGDYDAGQLSLDEAADRLAALGVEAFFYTSPSHTPEAPRWRVLAPLSRPRPREGRRQLLGVLNAALGGVLTPESFTDSQTYYFGRVTGVEYQTRHTRGVTIDALELALEPVLPTSARASAGPSPQASSVPPLGLTTEQLRCALAALDADTERRKWLDVLMAVHHETAGSEEGFALVDEWSSTGAKYEGSDDVRGRWDSFGHNGRSPITAHALVRMANEAGAQIEIAQLEAANDFDVIPHQAPRPAPEAAISFVDFASLQHTLPPPRRWIWDQWLPRGSTTVLYGRGGHGKSLLAQQLALCIAKGVPFAGAATQHGPVLGLFAEDDADELLRRGAALYGAMGLEAGDAASLLHLDARAGKFNTLVTFGTNHLAKPTSLMASLREQCRALRPVLIILDNIAQMYAGEENNRHEVTAFCNEVTGLAREFDCAALLLGHLAKAEESEYSGSTAWDAAVRSRLLLARQDDGTTVLRRVKANYSDRDEVLLEWRGGAFAQLPTARDADPETLAEVKPQIVRAMQVLTGRKQAASHLKTARNYLVKLMREEIDLHASIRPELLEAAVRAMLDAGELVPAAELPWKNSSRHAVTGLALP